MTSMSSDYEDSDDGEERSECEGYDKPVCAVCSSFMRQRDDFSNKWKDAEKRLGEEKALRLERDNEISKVKMRKKELEDQNNEYVNAISEVAEKMFYCGKDEGGSSINSAKKGNCGDYSRDLCVTK